jgi:F-type H+-transporting ATPase subunit b
VATFNAPYIAWQDIDFLVSIWYISSMLDLNYSLFWIFFIVWGLYIVLNRIFFKPVSRIIDEREAKIAADSHSLESMLGEIEAHTKSLEGQLAQARKDSFQIKENWLKNGEQVREKTVTLAKEQAARFLEEKMAELEEEIVTAEAILTNKIAMFSEKIKQAYL